MCHGFERQQFSAQVWVTFRALAEELSAEGGTTEGRDAGERILGQGLMPSVKGCPFSSVGISLICWRWRGPALRLLDEHFGESERS